MAVEEKLRNGDDLLNQAGNDKKLCGISLLAYHGALEDFFREELGSIVSNFERENKKDIAGWLDLVNLWEKHREPLRQHKNTILSKNTIRQDTAHGSFVEVDRDEAERYARFVKDFIKQNSSYPAKYKISPLRSTQTASNPAQSSRPTKQASSPIQSSTPNPKSNRTSRPRTKAKWSCRRRLAFVIIIILLLSCWPLLSLSNNFESFIQDNPTRQPGRGTRIISTVEVEEEKAVEEETAVTTTPTSNTKTTPGTTRIQVVGTSNVRSDPDIESLIVGYAYYEEEYDVIEMNADETWYKIRLADGTEGWLGSSRAEKLSP